MTDIPEPIANFIQRWSTSGGGEIANSQSFLKELCDLLDLPHPEPTQPDETANRYVFEKAVLFNNGDGTTSQGRIDLYRAGHFVLESKQGSEQQAAAEAAALAKVTKRKKRRTGTATRGTPAWDQAMTRARQQAKRYAEAIPDEWPPFLIVCDVGHCFDLYADFTQSGKNYVPFPDPQNYRLKLDRLEDESVRDLLRAIWTDPLALDPSRRSAAVTRELAASLAKLARSLEGQNDNTPERVAAFLMRCLFTMFAEDIGLLPAQGFTEALIRIRDQPDKFAPMVGELWKTMNTGGFSNLLLEDLLRFNGGLFEECDALPLNADQLELLIEAGSADWRDVEPAIFGTLLERALDPIERHKLGAHYTPRAYVERLVMPTLIEPLREQWETTYTAAAKFDEDGDRADAVKTIRAFHEQLCETRVLDPACGSGNFLYVALELMKRLEGEVLNAFREFGETQIPLLTIDPHQFLGIEVNPRAAAITDLVLWIGYLQWHFRTRGQGTKPREPVIRNFHNIECRDAVLAWDAVEEVTDDEGNPVTRWDGRTTKKHPVTREEVPDETAQVTELRYVNPRKAEWPEADYVVGNPPFVGNKRMRKVLGSGYVDALRSVWPKLRASTDYVMYWWYRSGRALIDSNVNGFGLITTNSIRQKLNRRVVDDCMEDGLRLSFAIPDHPWVDSQTCADVRISMTVGAITADNAGIVETVIMEETTDPENPQLDLKRSQGTITSSLTTGIAISEFRKLEAIKSLAFRGVILGGSSFVVDSGIEADLSEAELENVFEFKTGTDMTKRNVVRKVIDLFPMDDENSLLELYPQIYQRLYDNVRPHRQTLSNEWRKRHWWLFSDPARSLRDAVDGIDRYIVTPRTAEHRFFTFVPSALRIESEVVAICSSDAFILGVCSSKFHQALAILIGGNMGVGNQKRYEHSECFPRFPFPDPDPQTRQRIRELGEQLDAHRKRQQQLHPDLTMTGTYNVLEKLRAGETLTKKEQTIHEQGLVSVLKEIHDKLDQAVADAYGWPHDIADEEILQRLVDLNAQRAAEEATGHIRYLRPEFQNPAGTQTKATQKDLGITPAETPPAKPTTKPKKQPWPKPLPERIAALRQLLGTAPAPLDVDTVAKHFTRARKTDVAELLETLSALGHARQTEDGRFVE